MTRLETSPRPAMSAYTPKSYRMLSERKKSATPSRVEERLQEWKKDNRIRKMQSKNRVYMEREKECTFVP